MCITSPHAGLQTKRIKKEIESLESQTGMKLRVLAQNYPQTPGSTLAHTFLRADRQALINIWSLTMATG